MPRVRVQLQVAIALLLVISVGLAACQRLTAEKPPRVAETVTTSPVFTSPISPEPTRPLGRPLSGKVAFHSDASGDLEIWLLDLSDFSSIQLTRQPGRDIDPDWSPDGQQLVFSSARDDPENLQLYIMDSDGRNAHALLPFVAADHLAPRWSPDGRRIAFYTNRDGQFEIYTVSVDGTELTRLTNHDARDMYPDWSPDGRQLVFISDRDGRPHLYTLDMETGEVRQITQGAWRDGRPAWRDNGEIAFMSDRLGRWGLFLMRPGDSEARRLSMDVRFQDRDPAWIGAGYLAFSSDRARGFWHLFVMDVETGDVWPLFQSGRTNGSPSWTPSLSGE